MRTVLNLFILLVSALQGNVYLRCVYLISLYNAGVNGCSLKLKLRKETIVTPYMPTLPYTHRSPAFWRGLPNLPDNILFWASVCALVWDLVHFSGCTGNNTNKNNNNNNNNLLFIKSKNSIQIWSHALYFRFSQLERY